MFLLDFARHFNLVANEVYTITLRWGASGAGLDAAALSGQISYKEVVTG